MPSSSDEEFEEMGINLKEFARKRQSRFGMRTPVVQQQDPVLSEDEVPRELEYVSLLCRAMAILKKDKDSNAANRIQLSLEVKRESKKTSVNIMEIAETLNRPIEHLAKFMSGGLMAMGSVNKDGKLLLEGSFIKSQIHEVIRRYIEYFVVCKACENIGDTNIIKDKKLYFLRCQKCGSARCVGNIAEGITTREKAKPKFRGML